MLSTEIKALNHQKTFLFNFAQMILEAANHLNGQIALGYHAEADAFECMVSAQKGKISASTVTIAKNLSTRSMKELLQARYWVIKSYENLFMEPFPGDKFGGPIAVDTLLNNVADAVQNFSDPEGHLIDDPSMWKDQYKAVTGLLKDMTHTVKEDIIKRLTEPSSQNRLTNESNPILYVSLSKAELAHLNDLGISPRSLSINLSDRAGFPLDHDLVVIESIDVKIPALKQRRSSDPASSDLSKQTFTMSVGHTGEGLLKAQNKLYVSRAGRFDAQAIASGSSKGPTALPIVHGWNFTFDGTGKLLKSSGKNKQTDLEKSALGLDDSATQLFNMLPAWTELQLHFSSNSEAFDVLELEIEIAMRSIAETQTTGMHVVAKDAGSYSVNLSNNSGDTITYNTPFSHFAELNRYFLLGPAKDEPFQIIGIENQQGKFSHIATESAGVRFKLDTEGVVHLSASVVQKTH